MYVCMYVFMYVCTLVTSISLSSPSLSSPPLPSPPLSSPPLSSPPLSSPPLSSPPLSSPLRPSPLLPSPPLSFPLLSSPPLPSLPNSRAETWPPLLYLTHYPKMMLEQLKERLDLNSHTACTVTFQFTEPVHNIASLKAITNMDPRDVCKVGEGVGV